MIYQLAERRVRLPAGSYYVAPNAMVIGSVTLGDSASVWFNAVIRGDNEAITIGARSNVQDGSVLHADPGVPLTIGQGVTIGHLVMLHGCTVGDNSLIGINAVVLNRAVIGNNSIVGAGTLITQDKSFPDGVMILGSPGRVARELTDEEIAALKEPAQHYVDKIQVYQQGLRDQTD